MDQTAQDSQNQQSTVSSPQSVSVQPVSHIPPQTPLQSEPLDQAPLQPTSQIQKEREPYPSSQPVETAPFIEASEKEPTLHPEVAEAGVEAVSEIPKLTPAHTQVGIQPAKETTPVSIQPHGIIQLPMTEAEALEARKQSWKLSSTWLGLLIEKFFQRSRLNTIKE